MKQELHFLFFHAFFQVFRQAKATAAWQISEGQSTLGTFACVFMLFNVVPANSEF